MTSGVSRRGVLAGLTATAALGGCQTVPTAKFTAKQMELLERAGFQPSGENYLLGIQNRVLFKFDSSVLQDSTRTMLIELGQSLANVGIRSAGIEGHASAEGEADYNLRLSEQRAHAVRQALSNGGLNSAALRVRGVGALDPVAPNDSEEGRQQNRRVVIIVTPSDAISLQ